MKMETRDGLTPAVWARSELEAQAQAAILRDEGIPAFVFPAREWAGFSLNPREKGVPVFVPHLEAERAAAMLTQRVEDSVDLDWDEVDVGERVDDIPGRQVGRTPALARVGVVIGIILVLLTLLAWTLGMRPF